MTLSLLEAAEKLNESTYDSKIPTVFCDCDGVLADFNTIAKELLGVSTNEELETLLNRPGTWENLAFTHPKLFSQAPPLADARELVETLVSLRNNQLIRLKVLTALPNSWLAMPAQIGEAATQDKKTWVHTHFPEIEESDVIVCARKDKAVIGMADKILTRNAPVLIDDYNKNITEWAMHTRGYAIEHKTAADTIRQIKIYIKGLRLGATMPSIFDNQLTFDVSKANESLEIPIILEVSKSKKPASKKNSEAKPKPSSKASNKGTPIKKQAQADKVPQQADASSLEPGQKIIGIDHKGETIASNKRDLPKGKGEDPEDNFNNDNDLDGPVPASTETGGSVIVLHPPSDRNHIISKDKIGLKS